MLHSRDWLDALEGAAGYTRAQRWLHGWTFWGWQKGETELRERPGKVGGRSEKTEQDRREGQNGGCSGRAAWGLRRQRKVLRRQRKLARRQRKCLRSQKAGVAELKRRYRSIKIKAVEETGEMCESNPLRRSSGRRSGMRVARLRVRGAGRWSDA